MGTWSFRRAYQRSIFEVRLGRDDCCGWLYDAGVLREDVPPRTAGDDDLTVVIPAFGLRDGLLDRAVCSALPGRVLIVDDASPGGTVAELAERHQVGYVRRSENGGVAASQNTGLDKVSTGWVQFLHSDDVLAASARGAERGSAVDVLCGPTPSDARCLGRSAQKELLEHSVGVHISNYQFRTDVLREVRFDENLRAWEDWDLLYRMAKRAPKCQSTSATLAQVSADSTDRLSASRAMLEGLSYLYTKHGDDLRDNSAVRSIWEFKLARMSLRYGDTTEARKWMRRSLVSDPLHPRRVFAFSRELMARRAARPVRASE